MSAKSIDRIWIVVCALVLALTVAGAVQALAASPEEIHERARRSLNAEKWSEAAELYRQLYLEHREADAAADARYWEAFALYRSGKIEALRRAARALEEQLELYPEARTHRDSEELAARLYGELAERGDAAAARRLHEITGEDRAHQTRMAALQALMMMDEERALPILRKLVTNPDADIELRRQAIFLAGQMDDDEGEDLLLQVLEKEQDPELRAHIVMWLAHRGSERSLDAIVKAYRESRDPEVAQAALFALGEHGGARALELLEEIALDTKADRELRAHAVMALGQSDSPGLGELLVSILRGSDDPEMKQVCLYALSEVEGGIPDQVYLELIDDAGTDDELRAQALHFAADRGTVSLEFIKKVYDDTDDRDLKAQCCWVLADMGGDESLELLMEIVRLEKDPEVRQQAVFWIGEFDSDKAAEFLLELINAEGSR